MEDGAGGLAAGLSEAGDSGERGHIMCEASRRAVPASLGKRYLCRLRGQQAPGAFRRGP